MDRGSGTVGSAVASDTRDLQFKSQHRQNFQMFVSEHVYEKN